MGVPDNYCLFSVEVYLVLSYVFMACGMIARYDIMYGHFLRNSKRYRIGSVALVLLYIVGFGSLAGAYYFVSLQDLVYDFLSHGNLVRILKFFAVLPYSLLVISVFLLHVLALKRGSFKWDVVDIGNKQHERGQRERL
jgi:hypothetical protein